MFSHRKSQLVRHARVSSQRPTLGGQPDQGSSELGSISFYVLHLAKPINSTSEVIVLGWIALAAVLYFVAPRWEQVTKDDNVRFFPPDSRSVVGQDLLESGFPQGCLELQSGPGS